MAATMSPSWGVYSGFELFEHRAVREGSEEYLDSEKYELRPRDFEAALAEGESLEPFLTRLNEIRRVHPALRQLRTITFHHIDNDALLAYSKFDPITGDTVLVVVTLNPFGPEEGTLWLDMAALGMQPYDRFWVRDEITGEEYQWGQANYVRLEPARAVAHILNMPQIPAEQRATLLCAGMTGTTEPREMTRSEELTSPHLRPDPGDLNRLLAGRAPQPARDPRCARVRRPHRDPRATARTRVEVAALVGGERYPFTHIDSGLFAVALPFTDLVDYRLEVSYPGADSSPTSTPWPTRTGSCPRSARWICTCSPRGATNGCGRSSVRTRAASPPPTAWSRACRSRCGHRMPRASA